MEACIASKNIVGGTAPEQVKKQLAKWKDKLR